MNCVKVDEICEEMRKSLEHCVVDSDIHLFVSMKKTGSERPAKIEYENYYMTQSSQKVLSPGSNVNISGPLSGTFQHSKEIARVQSSPDTPKTAMRRPQMQLPGIPAPEPVDDSMYSAVDQTNKPKDTNVKKTQEQYCRAEFDYEAQGDHEISFKAGDLIKRLYDEDETWCCGELNGKKGMFPKAFVVFITK